MLASDRPEMPHLTMQGAAVFRWASFEMAKTAQAALDRAGVSAEDLDVFVPHQANMRIIDAMARSMKLPDRVKIARDIAVQGNTSAASIPLALDRMIQEGEARAGHLALLIAFGAGSGVRRPGRQGSLTHLVPGATRCLGGAPPNGTDDPKEAPHTWPAQRKSAGTLPRS